MRFFYFFFLAFPINLFPQTATKQDIQTLREDIKEQNRIIREDMNKRFEQVDKKIEILREDMNKRFEMMQEQNRIIREDMNKKFEIMQEQNRILREDMNKRFEDLFRFIGILYVINFAFLGYLWREIRRIETKKYDIAYLEEQIYRAKPEVKARIYFHIKEESEKYRKKTSI